MLVLTRHKGERITIGDNIEIYIANISDNVVTIGISAPKNIKILRSELEKKSDRENRGNK